MAATASSQIHDDQPPARPDAEPVDAEPVEPRVPEGEEGPPGTDANLPPIVDPEGELEELEDRSAPVDRLLWANMPVKDVNGNVVDQKLVERTYVQKGIPWFGKIELYGILGQAVKVVLEGDNPLGVGSLLGIAKDPQQMISDLVGNLPGAESIPGQEGETDAEMEMEAGKMLAALAQVVSMAPQLLEQAYCIALSIPKTHRVWAIEWAFPNMDDEMGKDILHTFIAQNWGVLEDFFAHEIKKIIRRIVQERRRHSDGRR